MNILWLDEASSDNPTLVGGKVAKLSRLAAEYAVPPGFCLTTIALEQWATSVKAQKTDSGPSALPATLYAELVAAYRRLAEHCGVAEPAVAVRSSAMDEDSAIASFAGQHETYLNVIGVEAVIEAVERCWASARSSRALEYRRQHGLNPDGIRLTVLVQQLVVADISVVAFSANPVTKHTDEIVINANWGLGESIVSGRVTPDSYVVRKTDLTLVSRQVADKRYMTVPIPGGIGEVDVSLSRRTQSALNDAQIIAVARLASDLEAKMGWPVDLECAYQGEILYLLQCRPITTLAGQLNSAADKPMAANAVTWDQPEDAQLTWQWHKQAFSEPLTPLSQSVLLYHTQGWSGAFRTIGIPGAVRVRFMNGYAYLVWQFFDSPITEAADKAWREAEQLAPVRWAEEWLPAIQADLARWRAVNLPALANDDLSQLLHDVLNRQIRHWEIHAHMGLSPLGAVQRLIDWYLECFPDAPESEPYTLLQGQSNTSVTSNHQLWQLSQMVTPEVIAALQSNDWLHLPEPFQGVFAAYLDQFGHRTHKLGDPASPTWCEDPQPIAQLILNYSESDVPNPYLEIELLAAERETFTAAVRAKLSPDERDTFEELLACALANNPLTEDHAFWLDQQSSAALRSLCAEFARRLVTAGVLDQAEDMAYLTLDELTRWGFGLADPLRPRLIQRKTEHLANQQITPSAFLGASPQPQTWVDRFGGPASPLAAGPGEIRGIGASAGVARGPARVAQTLNEALALRRGEILVCISTDPNWTPLFGLAAALVTDAGGSLCHAAVVAREYRLPAVVGTHMATRIIKSGQIVEVDGMQGLVCLL